MLRADSYSGNTTKLRLLAMQTSRAKTYALFGNCFNHHSANLILPPFHLQAPFTRNPSRSS